MCGARYISCSVCVGCLLFLLKLDSRERREDRVEDRWCVIDGRVREEGIACSSSVWRLIRERIAHASFFLYGISFSNRFSLPLPFSFFFAFSFSYPYPRPSLVRQGSFVCAIWRLYQRDPDGAAGCAQVAGATTALELSLL